MPSGSTSPHRYVLLVILIVAILSSVVLLLLLRGKRVFSAPLQFRTPSKTDKPNSGLWMGVPSTDLEHNSVAETQVPGVEEPKQNDGMDGETVHRCTVDQDVKVLGRVLDRCATEEAARLAVEEDIYVSIKSTARYHDSRVLPSLQTWFQTVPADRINVVTDDAPNDTLYEVATKTGIEVVSTDCSRKYTREVLCCKSGNEYFHYFNATTKTGDLHKWYCHFDDDMYINIPALVKGLREALSQSEDGGVYYGRWPAENAPYGVNVSPQTLKELGYDMGGLQSVRWATGAAYCVTSTVMMKVKGFLTKHNFKTYCDKFGVGDDVTASILMGMAGYRITHTDKIRTQYDKERHEPLPPNVGFEELIAVSYGMYSGDLEDDPSRFLAYHCLLYPSTSWCQK